MTLRQRRRRIVKAGWLVAGVAEGVLNLFYDLFGTWNHAVRTAIIVAIGSLVVIFVLYAREQSAIATPEQVRFHLTSNDPLVNRCMIELMPKRMGGNPATYGDLTLAVKDCKDVNSAWLMQQKQITVIKSLEAKK